MDAADLRDLFIFDGLDDGQLAELAALGEAVPITAGVELFHEGDPAAFWWVLLDGTVDLVRQAGREQPVVMMTMERPGVWAGGFQAWDASSSYLATGRGASDGRMFRIPSVDLGGLMRTWFPFGVHHIEGFFQTVRTMDTLSRQRESLVALGGLAAGLAHEINNPASATARAAAALGDTCDLLLSSLAMLAEGGLTAEGYMAIDALRRELDPSSVGTDALAVADAEEVLSDWFDGHGVDGGWQLAPALAPHGVDVAWCERVAEAMDDETLLPAFDWVAATLSSKALVAEIQESTSRISALVDAVKSYSQLDRASTQVVDVTEGIESTLVMLGHKLDDVTVLREYGTDVPRVTANPGELNQVWTNLIDNAIDAMDGVGELRISTRRNGDELTVAVGDTGAGMPPAVQARAFEPFFTTKDVGKGTGLGLDISRRIVDRHRGRITIDSDSDGTTIGVHLPLPAPEP